MIRARMTLGSQDILFFFNADKKQEVLLAEMSHLNFGDCWLSNHYLEAFMEQFYKPFDYALPLSFSNEYVKVNGEFPRGVWCYRGNMFGYFVSRDEILNAMNEYVSGKFHAGEFEMEEK